MSPPAASPAVTTAQPQPVVALAVELALCEAAAFVVEVVVWGGPLYPALHNSKGAWSIAAAVGTTLWVAGVMRLFDVARPLLAVASARQSQTETPAELSGAALLAMVRLPGDTAVLRFFSWMFVAATSLAWLIATGAITAKAAGVVLGATFIHGAGAAALRGRLLEGRLRRLRPWLLPGADGMRVYMEVYRRRLARTGVLVLSAGHGMWLWFTASAVGAGGVGVALWGWPALFVGAVLCMRSLRRRTVPLQAYFNILYGRPSARGPARDEPTAAPAFRAAQALPYRLAGYLAFTLAVSLLGAVAFGRWRLGYSPSVAARLLVAAVVTVLAAGGYALLLLRRVMAPFLKHLGSRHHLPLAEIRSPASVGLRLALVFLAFGACLAGPWAISTSATAAVPWAPGLLGFVSALGLAWLITRDTLQPLALLELRSEEMARGELARPVSPAGEADEIGRLTVAFEEMRRALRDRLRSTESINVDLEREVRRRTDALEKRNAELADALDKLKRAQDDLVRSEKLASMGRLVAGIAHEINNPVNAVINSLDPLGEQLEEIERNQSPDGIGALTKDAKDMLSVIRRGAARTKAIVRALHNYSRGDEHQFRPVDLARVVGDTIDLLRHQLREIEVTVQVPQPCLVLAMPGQIDQVVMNIVVNAAQALEGATPDAGVPRTKKILIHAEQRSDEWYLTIADSGPGIPPDVLPKIFDPFFTTKVVGEGAGLGLSIVHGIVERHGGKLLVDSGPAHGTTFTMALPLAQAQDQANEL